MNGLPNGDPVTLIDVIAGFFSQNTAIIDAYLTASNGDRIAIMLVLIAGISEALGQSVILFANQVRPSRFVISIITAGLIFTVGFFAWTASIVVAMNLLLDIPPSWQITARVVALSYIPLFFAFLWLIPYIGNPIIILLYLWTFGALTEAVFRLTDVGFWSSFIVTIFGMIFILFLRATIGRPLRALADRLLNAAAGTRVERDLRSALGSDALYTEQKSERRA